MVLLLCTKFLKGQFGQDRMLYNQLIAIKYVSARLCIRMGRVETQKGWYVHACQVTSVVSDSSQTMDCSQPGSFSVCGIIQARILEWVAMTSSRGSSWPRDRTHVSYIFCTGRWVLYHQHHLGSSERGLILLFKVLYLDGVIRESKNLYKKQCGKECGKEKEKQGDKKGSGGMTFKKNMKQTHVSGTQWCWEDSIGG